MNFGPSPEQLRQLVVEVVRGARGAIEDLLPPGRITGPEDNRLVPREGVLYGRKGEVGRVLTFLRGNASSAAVSAEVTGVGGIGKTEVCKASLRVWMAERPATAVYYVEIPSDAEASELITRIGRALNQQVDRLDDLLKVVSAGLYYLDNLERVSETSHGQEVLRSMLAKPGVRLLASSRFSLVSILGAPILIDVLPREDALQLFRNCWPRAHKLPDDGELAALAIDRLGGHALSITLVARLGDCYTYADLVQRWDDDGTAVASDLVDDSRLGSLAKSLRITAEALGRQKGALSLWTTISLFGGQVSNELLDELEHIGGWKSARKWLVRHHILSRQENTWHMLPPVARFGLDESLRAESGFDWIGARKATRGALDTRAKAVDSIESTATTKNAGGWLTDNFDTWSRYVQLELASSRPDLEWLRVMSVRLGNLYQHRPIAARDVLRKLLPRVSEQRVFMQFLGDLEVQLGDFAKGKEFLELALRASQKEQDRKGQGWALRSLGELALSEGRPDEARERYDEAREVYKDGGTDIGFANLLLLMGRLERRQGNNEKAVELLKQALSQYEELKEKLGQANASVELGISESVFGRNDIARSHFRQALSLYTNEQQGRGTPMALKYLGDLELSSKRYDEAEKLFLEALPYYQKVPDVTGCADILRRLGWIKLKKKEFVAARRFILQSLELHGQQSSLGRANGLVALAELELALGDFSEGWKLYKNAVSLFASINEWPSVVKACLQYAHGLDRRGEKIERDSLLVQASDAAEKSGSSHLREMVQKATFTMRTRRGTAGTI